jgi:cytochrome c peroxidase
MLFDHAATASQATGPPNSDREMSFLGRNWFKIGRKMVTAKPLALQKVAFDDSVLGVIDNSPDATDVLNGLNPALTYRDLVQSAFKSKFWASNDLSGLPDNFTQMERNFSLFFGLSILCYESTLVSDDSRYDQYQDGGGEEGSNADVLTEQEKEGLDIFLNRGKCIECHAGSSSRAAR